MNLFDFRDYKEFIQYQVRTQKQARGYLSKLAEAAQIQKSYLSQVLHTKAHLTQEQAMKVCLFWKLDEHETAYFLELVNLGKTDFRPLRDQINRRLEDLKRHNEEIEFQSEKGKLADDQKLALYYAAWHYSAIHILVSIPSFQTVEAVSKRLELPKLVVEETLKELEQMKLVTHKEGKWMNIPGGLHNSPGTSVGGMHHQNWRQRAMLDYFRPKDKHLHYTDTHSLSLDDFQTLKTLLLETIGNFRKVVKASPEEELACLCLDYFKV